MNHGSMSPSKLASKFKQGSSEQALSDYIRTFICVAYFAHPYIVDCVDIYVSSKIFLH